MYIYTELQICYPEDKKNHSKDVTILYTQCVHSLGLKDSTKETI